MLSLLMFTGRLGGPVRTLGVHCAAGTLYLAVLDNGTVLDDAPATLALAAGLPDPERLPSLVDDVRRVVAESAVERVRVLDAEPTSRGTYASLVPRIAMETAVLLGATAAGVDAGRLTRKRVKSLLDLPAKGSLKDLARSRVDKHGAHWGPNKRDVAALAALAAAAE